MKNIQIQILFWCKLLYLPWQACAVQDVCACTFEDMHLYHQRISSPRISDSEILPLESTLILQHPLSFKYLSFGYDLNRLGL